MHVPPEMGLDEKPSNAEHNRFNKVSKPELLIDSIHLIYITLIR